jgi:hypothetical protein
VQRPGAQAVPHAGSAPRLTLREALSKGPARQEVS